jgi:hypothetical protein
MNDPIALRTEQLRNASTVAREDTPSAVRDHHAVDFGSHGGRPKHEVCIDADRSSMPAFKAAPIVAPQTLGLGASGSF